MSVLPTSSSEAHTRDATTPNAPPLHAAACRPAGPRPLHDPTGLQDDVPAKRRRRFHRSSYLLLVLVDEITGLPCPGAITVTHTGSYRARAPCRELINARRCRCRLDWTGLDCICGSGPRPAIIYSSEGCAQAQAHTQVPTTYAWRLSVYNTCTPPGRGCGRKLLPRRYSKTGAGIRLARPPTQECVECTAARCCCCCWLHG